MDIGLLDAGAPGDSGNGFEQAIAAERGVLTGGEERVVEMVGGACRQVFPDGLASARGERQRALFGALTHD